MYLLESSIRQAVKNLTQILQAYDLPWSVNSSNKSDSQYIYFTVNKKNVVFRISDHDLPNVSQGRAAHKDADFYFDYRADDYDRAKRKLLHFIKTYNIPKAVFIKVMPWVKYKTQIFNGYMKLLKKDKNNRGLIQLITVMDSIQKYDRASPFYVKWQGKTIENIIADAGLAFPKELQSILDKYGVE